MNLDKTDVNFSLAFVPFGEQKVKTSIVCERQGKLQSI